MTDRAEGAETQGVSTEEPATEPAAPASPGVIDGAPMVIMKGGTTPSSLEKEIHEREERSRAARELQDRQRKASAVGEGMTEGGFQKSSLTSLNLLDAGAPILMLYYLNRDRSVRQECISELLVTEDGTDSFFVLVCPKCIERRVPMGQAQIKIQRSHRKFDVDPRRAGELVPYVGYDGKRHHVRICGVVTCNDIIRCDAANCTWKVRITDSNVSEA